MLKLYKEQKGTIYEIQKDLKLSKYAIYKYVKGLSKIENMRWGTVERIAEQQKINSKELYKKMVEYEKINQK